MIRTVNPNPKTKVQLLDAAAALITAQGFAATTVEQICRKAKLTKGSFFHYFVSKEDLGKEVLRRFCAESFEKFRSGCPQEGDPLERVFFMIDLIMRSNAETVDGCLLGTLAQELSLTHPEIRDICHEGFLEWGKILKKDLDEAKALHHLSSDWDTQMLAEYFIAVVEGSQILGKVQKNPRIMQQNMEILKKYIRSLFKH